MQRSLSSEPFGTTLSGEVVEMFTLVNTQGMEMKVISFGGIITSLFIPDKEGAFEDVVLGYDNFESYVKSNPYFGAIIGRVGNRIAKGKFSLDGKEYSLAVNNGVNHLHGGIKGFDKVVWEAMPFENEAGLGLILTYESLDMEEGYPGKLKVKVTYTLGDDNTLQFDYEATTDKMTVINLTQHTYFNLTGVKENVLNHELLLHADFYLPVDHTQIPTGEIRSVVGTPFDFTKPKAIGKDINLSDEQLKVGRGYDHSWVLRGKANEMKSLGIVSEASSGRKMEVFTTEPAVQLYTGNFLNKSIVGKRGVVYSERTGLCLETQHYPDSPNQPDFPSVVLVPGETYKSATKLVFTVVD